MAIRTIEFILYSNKQILNRSAKKSIMKLLLVIVETAMVTLVCSFIKFADNTDYLNWGINAIIVFSITAVAVLGLNMMLYKNDFRAIAKLIEQTMKKK